MSVFKGLFNVAAATALINAVVHLAGAATAQFDASVYPTMIGCVLWVLCAIGLRAHQRWLAYLAFTLAWCGALFAYSQLGTDSVQAQWTFLAMLLLDITVAMLTFLIVWRRHLPAS